MFRKTIKPSWSFKKSVIGITHVLSAMLSGERVVVWAAPQCLLRSLWNSCRAWRRSDGVGHSEQDTPPSWNDNIPSICTLRNTNIQLVEFPTVSYQEHMIGECFPSCTVDPTQWWIQGGFVGCVQTHLYGKQDV